MTLDHDIYPHIFDAIVAHAPYPALLRLRATSRPLRDRVDRILVSHIALKRAGTSGRALHIPREYCVRGNHLYSIPRAMWVRDLGDAVRVVDILDIPFPMASGPGGSDRYCHTCGELRSCPASHLTAYRHLQVELVCYWHAHTCQQPIRASRSVHYWTPGHERSDHWSSSAVHVTHRRPGNWPAFHPYARGSEHVMRLGPIDIADEGRMAWHLWNKMRFPSRTLIVGAEAWSVSSTGPGEPEAVEAVLRQQAAEYEIRLHASALESDSESESESESEMENESESEGRESEGHVSSESPDEEDELHGEDESEEDIAEKNRAIRASAEAAAEVELSTRSHRLKFISEADYRASIGDRLYALEAWRPEPTVLD